MASRPRHRARRFRPTGVGSYTAASSHPCNARFFADLDARLARMAPPILADPAMPLRSSIFPPAPRA